MGEGERERETEGVAEVRSLLSLSHLSLSLFISLFISLSLSHTHTHTHTHFPPFSLFSLLTYLLGQAVGVEGMIAGEEIKCSRQQREAAQPACLHPGHHAIPGGRERGRERERERERGRGGEDETVRFFLFLYIPPSCPFAPYFPSFLLPLFLLSFSPFLLSHLLCLLISSFPFPPSLPFFSLPLFSLTCS